MSSFRDAPKAQTRNPFLRALLRYNGFRARVSDASRNDDHDSTFTPPNDVTRPRCSITIWVASWRSSAASWLT
jgi:hypothetical protein